MPRHIPKLQITVEGPGGEDVVLDTEALAVDERDITGEMLRQHGLIAWYGMIYRHHKNRVAMLQDKLTEIEDDLDATIRRRCDARGEKHTEKAIAAEIRRSQKRRIALSRLREAEETLGVVQSFWDDVKQRGLTLHDLGDQFRAEAREVRTMERDKWATHEARKRKAFAGPGDR